MNVVLLAEEFGGETLSPSGIWLRDLAGRWAARGHHIAVVCPDDHQAGPAEIRREPAGVIVFRPTPDQLEEALAQALSSEPDVVHVASPGPFGSRVLEALRDLPLLVDVHDFWPICPNRDLIRRPHLEPCDEHFPFLGCGPCAGLQRLRHMDERAQLAASARMVLTHSSFSRMRLRAGLGRKVELLGYGVDTSRFRPTRPPPPRSPTVRTWYETPDRPRVLFLGQPTAARGAGLLADLLVALHARVPDVELVIAGRDPDHPDWEEIFHTEIRELGLTEHAVLLPAVPSEDLPALYHACLVAISPGFGYETNGLFLLHALAAGVPIVAHPADGIDEWVHPGVEGVLVTMAEIGAFADAVAALLADPIARMTFGEAGRLSALEHHDFERSVVELETLYRKLRATPDRSAAA
ncbi:MAG TPA: glycosyltransferase family 4 protein [Candidatus Limnocylindria bacterium]|nr:glycosyltransferase family 4 protein [Candidatus Limnocylindria bacterium]